MMELVGILVIVICYFTAYLISLYSRAVYIDPDEVEEIDPGQAAGQTRFLMRLADDPRTFVQVAVVYKTAALIVVSVLTTLLLVGLAAKLELAPYLLVVPGLAWIWLSYVMVVEYSTRRASRRAVSPRMLRHVWIIASIYYLCYPVLLVYRSALGRAQESQPVSEEEKEEIVERAIETLAEEAGIGESIVEDDEKQMIGQIFLLDQTVVREILIPRIDITGIERGMSFKSIRQLVLKDGHSRYPVYDNTIDKIVGLVYVKDLFSNMPEPGEKFVIENYLRDPYFVPETKIIGELLQEFKSKRLHIAIVVDEYGGVAGLVTLEDILEEIFGEIQDEHDAEEAEYYKLPDGRFRVSASLMVEKLQVYLDTDYPQGDYDTVGGLIYDLVGSVPSEGQKVRWHQIEFELERIEGQRILSVTVKR
ncbi:MAG: hemolysin family protein [candidate division Zixibacteria bacterium]|nr:hemolysin family protein [candidate division Zixibacteria bacterium]MDH3937719.1 hemolysin family protein [candidate division Zixibacteria bacterium]MDH4032827.1 hemolysin family protein [candidate division Zixibacteria bacterium]